MKRKSIIAGSIFILFILVLFLFKTTILKCAASYLMVENALQHTEYAFVLSGSAFDRGNKAAELYHKNKIEKIICTGANQSPDLKALGTDTLESDLTKLQIIKQGVPDSAVFLLKIGTSTQEESEAIVDFCKQNNIKQIAIISSYFHTRRVNQVFKKRFNKEGIEIFIQGAPSSVYNEMEWWKNEYGLIALNNEYIKQLYYLIKF